VEYIDNVTTPLPYNIDWNTVTNVSDVAQVVDGKWQLTAQGVDVVEKGYDRLITLGDLSWTNYEAVVEVTLNALPTGTAIAALAVRWTGHFEDGEQPNIVWWPLGMFAGYQWQSTGDKLVSFGSHGLGVGSSTVAPADVIGVGVKHLFKIRVENDIYSFKYWPASGTEPSTWNLTWTHTTETPPPPISGSLLLAAHHVDLTFGNVSAIPLGGN
jgi:hypothetical protein